MRRVMNGFLGPRIQYGRLAAVLLVAAVLAGCAVPTPRPGIPAATGTALPPVDPPALPAEESQPVETAPAEPAPAAPAALALAAQSEQAIAAGDLRLAGLQLERALRIAPRDPGLWHRLAQVRLQQGEFQQAERMAERSLQLGSTDRSLVLENWRVIARAREGLGDAEGARRALDEVRRLERALG
jgi:tetratricopeptide (TPR) repeat protein